MAKSKAQRGKVQESPTAKKAFDQALGFKKNVASTDADAKSTENARIKDLVMECITIGEDYRMRFRKTWDELERQVRMVSPAEWDNKEDWQSKVYIGQQAKTSESAFSNMDGMVFPSEGFFNITATKNRDRDQESALEDLFKGILRQGNFYQQKDYVLEESIDHGTAWLKLLVKPDKTGIDFVFRSCYDCLVDPHCGANWDKARFWVDQYEKDGTTFFQDEMNDAESIYDKDMLQGALTYLNEQAAASRKEEIERIRTIDGTGWMAIPRAYKSFIINEFWGLLPMPIDGDPSKGFKMQWRTVSLINKTFMIRNEESAFDFIPAVPARLKHRKYDFYGKGYLLNGIGTQDLMNSMVNLGFDSAKINSMDIIVLDANRIADQTSIQYKPLAVWQVKGNPGDAVRFTRQSASSALMDILNGLNLLDQIHQDVTGVTKHAEGGQSLEGKGEDQTLGEFKMKMQSVDKRFMSIAKRFEQDFIVTLLRCLYKIISDPKLYSQNACEDLIGKKPVMINDPASNVSVRVGEMPRLVLKNLTKRDVMEWNFSGSGVMQFSQRQEIMQKLQQALAAAMQNPTLTMLTNIDTLWRRIFQVSDIPDWEEIVKSKDDVQKLKDYMQQQQQAQMAPPPSMIGPGGQAGMPQRPPMGGGQPPAMPPPRQLSAGLMSGAMPPQQNIPQQGVL